MGYLEVLQASGTLVIRGAPEGECLPGWAHRSGTCAAALAPQAEWAFGSPNALPVLASQN
jgi:hypothetical protein